LGFHHFKSEYICRWQAKLEEFDYTFIYCNGKDNTVTDMLSLYPMTTIETPNFEEITTLEDSSFPATTFNIKQSQDPLPELINYLSMSKNYTTIKREGINIICRIGNIVLSPSLFDATLAWYHINLNHPGQNL
jgi:hypothetical protein